MKQGTLIEQKNNPMCNKAFGQSPLNNSKMYNNVKCPKSKFLAVRIISQSAGELNTLESLPKYILGGLIPLCTNNAPKNLHQQEKNSF